MQKSLILLSGGLDSGVLLSWARRRGFRLATLSFFFPGRQKMEAECANKLLDANKIEEHYELTLPFLDSPKSESFCYIPQRNLLYYSTAACLAEKVRADFICGGHVRHDAQLFQDARPDFFAALKRMIRMGSKNKSGPKILTPFIGWSKASVLRLGKRLHMPFEHTWSCCKDGVRHCWTCVSCKEREQGFQEAGFSDPLKAPAKAYAA